MAGTTHHFNLDPKQVTIAALGLLDRQLTLGAIPARYSELNFHGGLGDVINVNRDSRSIKVQAENVSGIIKNTIKGDDTLDAAVSVRPDATDRRSKDGYVAESRFPVSLDTLAQNSATVSMEQIALDIQQFGRQILAPLTRGFAEYFDDTVAQFIKANVTRSALTPDQVGAIGGDVEVHIPAADGTRGNLAERATLIRAALVDARMNLNLANVPQSERYIIAGPQVEAILLKDPEFVAVDYSGDQNALRRAVIGRIYGFDIVIHNSFGLEMYLFHKSALLLASAAPAIPMGAIKGSMQNVNGIASRLLFDYDYNKKADTLSLDTMYGLTTVKEDPYYEVNGVQIGRSFVRGLAIKVVEDAADPS